MRNRCFLFVAIVLAILGASCANLPKNDAHLVDLQKVIPGLAVDIRYATTNNFTGQLLYPSAKCYLRAEAAEQLKRVQADLKTEGLALKVFDGYRPLSVQKKMWAIYPNPGYVADPKKGSRHNRGAAVDLTLITLDGVELPMGTPFDTFSIVAHSDYTNLPPDILHNRELLRTAMTHHRFHELPTEWWHFDFKGGTNYPILDIDYSQLK